MDRWRTGLILLCLGFAMTAAGQEPSGTPVVPLAPPAGAGTSEGEASAPDPRLTGTALVMFDQDGCIYCAAWTREVGDAYDRTQEGRVAPLWRIDIQAPRPEGLELEGPAVLTPTFVLIRDGVEMSRLEGYPGEDFFWGLLARMLAEAGVEVPPAPAAPTGGDGDDA